MKKTIQAAVFATLASACGVDVGTRPLNEEEREVVQHLVEQNELLSPVVIDLLDASEPLFVSGEYTEDNALLIKAVEHTTKRLSTHFEKDQIVAYDFDSVQNTLEMANEYIGDSEPSAEGALDMPIEGLDYLENNTGAHYRLKFVALNPKSIDSWSTSLLMHEVGHERGDHTKAVKEAFKSGVSKGSKEWGEAIMEGTDYSYLLSDYFTLVERGLKIDQKDLDTEGGIDVLIQNEQDMGSEEWTDMYVEKLYEHSSGSLSVYGLDQERVEEILLDHGIFEARQELLQEIRSEGMEATREAQQETEAGKRSRL